jgi:transcriptional regulator
MERFRNGHGSNALVSPAHYEKIQNVPTWNYIAVHAYGTARIIHDKVESYAVLDKMIRLYEPAYLSQWEGLPETYREGMLKGIVSFEITVTKLEGKYKLSQNKTDKERERIVDSFEKSPDEGARRLAEEMKRRDYGIM